MDGTKQAQHVVPLPADYKWVIALGDVVPVMRTKDNENLFLELWPDGTVTWRQQR